MDIPGATNPENGETLEEFSLSAPSNSTALNRAISALVAEQGGKRSGLATRFAHGRVPKRRRFARSCARGWIFAISRRHMIARYRRLWRGW
jgi:hypothetical protein